MLYYWRKSANVDNFGDYLGAYLYWKIVGQKPTPRVANQPHWVTIGSLLSGHHINEHSKVWGSGIISRNATFPKARKFYSVRGPYSRDRCLEQGYTCPKIYGDPALLLPRFYKPKPRVKVGVGVVVHHREKIPSVIPEGVCFIKLTHRTGDAAAAERIIDQIAACDLIVSSSLHGVIVAHAYGIPAVWCQYEGLVGPDNIKFLDYYHGIGMKAVTAPFKLGQSPTLSAVEWLERTSDYPQPKFPINTDQLWKYCPLRHLRTVRLH